MKKTLLLIMGISISFLLGGCTAVQKSSQSSDLTMESFEVAVSSSSSNEKFVAAIGNELSGTWRNSTDNSGVSTSNIDITVSNNSKDSLIVDSSNLALVYLDKDNGSDTLNSSHAEKKTIKPNESITFNKVIENVDDQRLLYGFSIKYGNYSVFNEAAKTDKDLTEIPQEITSQSKYLTEATTSSEEVAITTIDWESIAKDKVESQFPEYEVSGFEAGGEDVMNVFIRDKNTGVTSTHAVGSINTKTGETSGF